MGVVAVEDEPALAALIERVERGETVEITRGGRVIGALKPPRTPRPEVEAAIALIREARRGVRFGDDVSLEDYVAQERE